MRLIAKQARRAAMGCGVLAAMLLLASCGGSASRLRTSTPSRVIAFGDETSSIVDIDGNFNGHKFSVNGTASATDPTIDCRSNPIWIQTVAAAFGTSSSRPATRPARRCSTRRAGSAPPSARAPPTWRRRSTRSWPRARFRDGDLVTVLVGANDVLAAVRPVPGRQRGPAHRQRRGRRRGGRPAGQPPRRRRRQGASSRPSPTSASRPTRAPRRRRTSTPTGSALIQRLVAELQRRPEAGDRSTTAGGSAWCCSTRRCARW